MLKWDVVLKELKGGNQLSKARKFNKLKCVAKCDHPDIFYILPIEGYNKTTYTVNIEQQKCNCQYNVRSEKPCSHIMAVLLYQEQQEEKK